ncbi:hypothetical protein HJC23_001732 [Cyclotella cryptica]|uniref:SET domain-containing protein n=1 Tax=Cyclotella cryptica TaxID=29204 RepID=A0ABD3QP26_9STRA|eukprot:CCRYP_003279-RB/>CCRYP_003279-RB protein AED:0.03 eAED:0.03 QI:104/1/1/1/1/1/2/372/522
MKHSCLAVLFIPSEAFTPPSTPTPPTTTTTNTRTDTLLLLHSSQSGHEKRTHRPSIAPLSPHTGATSSSGPIGSSSGVTTVHPFPPNPRLPATKYSEQILHDEIHRLRHTLNERNDDVDTLVYEVVRLREWNQRAKIANEARSNDLTLLRKEAERLKHEFETRNRQNEDKVRWLTERLEEERRQCVEELEKRERLLREKDEMMARLQQRQVNEEDGVTRTMTDMEVRWKNDMGSPSPEKIGSGGRVPHRQYRETMSYDENKQVARVGGAPIMYRPPKQSGMASEGRAGFVERVQKRAVDSTTVLTDTPTMETYAQSSEIHAPWETAGESTMDSIVDQYMVESQQSKSTISTSDLPMDTPARQSLPSTFRLTPIPGKGLGIITTQSIPAGQVLGEYKGEVIDASTKDRRYLSSQSHEQTPQDWEWRQSRLDRGQGVTGTYLYGVTQPNEESVYVDAEDEYNSLWTRFINHASPPGDNVDPKSSCETWNGEPRVWFVSNRDIDAGEEICFDYGDDYWLPDDNVV